MNDTFVRHGVIYRQVRRAGLLALLELKYEANGPVVGWDVVLLVRRPKRAKIGGVIRDTAEIVEMMPPSEAWGRSAWSFDRLETAERKFLEVSES